MMKILSSIERPRVLLIYTGGTIGMIQNHSTGSFEAFNFEHLRCNVPELNRFDYEIAVHQFDPPIDSSDMTPEVWKKLVGIIYDNYVRYDGFVILHGTDTMAYTASALSFMLENLSKPVVLTGSQLPIGMLRTDGKENLITAVEIAAARDDEGRPRVPEVCVYFQQSLLRGNRTTKFSADNFNAFRSNNFPPLGHAGVDITYATDLIRHPDASRAMKPHFLLDSGVLAITLFPGLEERLIRHIFSKELVRGLILRTFGSGNGRRQGGREHHTVPDGQCRDGTLRDGAPTPGCRCGQWLQHDHRGCHHQTDVPAGTLRRPRASPFHDGAVDCRRARPEIEACPYGPFWLP